MTEPTKQMIEVARRIWASQCEGDTSGVLSGALDGAAPMKLALAAIIETTETIADFIERDVPVEFNGNVVGRCSGDMITAGRIRAGEHYRKEGE